MSTLEEWLQSKGLQQYTEEIKENGIQTLQDLKDFDTLDDLNEIASLISFRAAHRMKFVREAKKIANISSGSGNNNNNNNNQNNTGNNGENNQRLNDMQNRIFGMVGNDNEEEEEEDEESGPFGVLFNDGPRTPRLGEFTGSTTVATMKRAYASHINVLAQWESFRFTANGTNLTVNTKTLRQCNITVHTIVYVHHPTQGGSQMVRVRKLRKSKFGVKAEIVMGKDCIMNDITEPVAKMKPCGHTISSNSMFYYITAKLSKNLKLFKIKCPVKKCRKEWDWKTCCAVADLTTDEYIRYTNQVNRRREMSTGETKQCVNPKCRRLCFKSNDLKTFRVSCGSCKGPDFCFVCNGIWKSSGATLCGNKNCPMEGRQKQLLQCNIITKDNSKHSYSYYGLDYGTDSNGRKKGIPEIRCCPRCYTLIQHTHACKHMRCRECSKYFCWVCLSLMDENGKYPEWCGGKKDGVLLNRYDMPCPLAPRQILQ